jgi:hypothetical protein
MVISSSATVLIGKSLAARVGDSCACFCASTIAVGVPPVVGPDAPPQQVSTDDRGRMADAVDRDVLEGDDPLSGFHAEAELLDGDRDGTYDRARAAVRVAHAGTEECADVGASEFCARQETEFGTADAEARFSSGDAGFGYGARAKAAAIEHESQMSIGPSGNGANPHAAVGAKGKLANAEADADVLLLHDGKDIGFRARGKAEAQVASGEVNGDFRITIGRYSLGFKAYAEGDVGGVGGGLGGGQYYDTQEDRFHWELMVGIQVLLGFELGFDISFGRDYPSELWATIVGRFPNSIVTGDATVLIG